MKKVLAIVLLIGLLLACATGCAAEYNSEDKATYEEALDAYHFEDYVSAAYDFCELGEYKKSEKYLESICDKAAEFYLEGEIEKAQHIFGALYDCGYNRSFVTPYLEEIYDSILEEYTDFSNAKTSDDVLQIYLTGINKFIWLEWEPCEIRAFEENYYEKFQEKLYELAVDQFNARAINAARELFNKVGDYKDSSEYRDYLNLFPEDELVVQALRAIYGVTKHPETLIIHDIVGTYITLSDACIYIKCSAENSYGNRETLYIEVNSNFAGETEYDFTERIMYLIATNTFTEDVSSVERLVYLTGEDIKVDIDRG